MIFDIVREPYRKGEKIFTKKKLELNPNSITCFVGCNGSGKSTLISEIKTNLRELNAKEIKADFFHNSFKKIIDTNDENNDILYIDFDKRTETTFNEMDYFYNAGALAFQSTGEGIMDRFGKHIQVIGTLVRKVKNKTIFIFMDDCDAGTSIDMIQDIKAIFEFIERDCKNNNNTYYIITTANSFEFCKGLDCICVSNFKHRTFKTYDAFKNFVLKSRKEKDKRNDEYARQNS